MSTPDSGRQSTKSKLKKFTQSNCLHVFFVANPMAELVAKMYAQKYSLPRKSIVICPQRGFETTLFDGLKIALYPRAIERLCSKFGFDLLSRRYANAIQKLGQKYVIYSSWHHPDIYHSVSSNDCLGHVYMEEGQLSYWRRKPVETVVSRKSAFFDFSTAKFAENNLNIFQDSAAAYLCINSERSQALIHRFA